MPRVVKPTPPRPSRQVRHAEELLSRSSSIRNSPSWLRSLPPARNGWTNQAGRPAYGRPRRQWPRAAPDPNRPRLSTKDPGAIAVIERLKVKSAYLDGELCGVDEACSPSFARIQAAMDGESDARLVYYAFDLLHLSGWDLSSLQLLERKRLLEPLVGDKPGLQFNGHDTGDGELIPMAP
jgi:hypothetical protein